MGRKITKYFGIGTVLLFIVLGMSDIGGSEMTAKVEVYVKDIGSAGGLGAPTQIAFLKGMEIITDSGSNRLLYREEGATDWAVSPIQVNNAHSICVGADNRFYVNDTGNHRMLSFPDITTTEGVLVATTIAGQPLSRPHDNILDPSTGYIYVIDGNRRLYRFGALGSNESFIQFSVAELDYARALKLIDGKVHIISSNHGEVLRIEDFGKKEYTKFVSHGKKQISPAGSWERTGFVLNDVIKHKDWFYGTNYFCENYAQGTDYTVLRLVRWRTWEDFETGNWQDLSRSLPSNLVPYFFTEREGALYFGAFSEPVRGIDDAIYRVTTRTDLRVAKVVRNIGGAIKEVKVMFSKDGVLTPRNVVVGID